MAEQVTPSGNRLMWLGMVLISLGAIATLTPVVAGSAVVIVIGILLLVAGIGQIIQGSKSPSWSEKIMSLVLGVITSIAGAGVIGHPLFGLGFLTLLLIIFFVMEGIWQIIVSFSYRPISGWLWMLISGIISVLLGILIWQQWPVSGLWAVGVLVGVDLLTTGISMMAIAFTIKATITRNRAKQLKNLQMVSKRYWGQA